MRAVAELVGLEIQIQKTGDWETSERFGPDALAAGRKALDAIPATGPFKAVRLVEERLTSEGFFKTRTLAFRKIEFLAPVAPAAAAARAAPRGAANAPVAAPTPKGRGAAPSRNGGLGKNASPGRGAGPARKTAAGSGKQLTPAQQMKASGSRFSFSDLLTYLFSPTREASDAVPVLKAAADGGRVTALPPPPAPVAKRGDISIFEDEAEMSGADLVAADATVRQFNSFVEVLNALEAADQARANPKFVHGISLFTIGALFSIEEQIDIFSHRGKAVVHACLELFVDMHETIAHFVGALERYLQDSDAPGWIRAGSRCFRMYRDAEFKGLEREFGETFGVYDKIEATLGGRVKVGILFTDIVNSTALTGELGDDAAQQIIDHHDAMVEGLARRFGGRKVKHLGDGLMLSFGSAQAMASCAVAVVDAMKGLYQQTEVPPYQIRCGGHFGEAIHKSDDFFGSTVQLAARVSGIAGNNEARFCSILIDGKNPIFNRFEDCGAATLKGFDQPMMLARYR